MKTNPWFSTEAKRYAEEEVVYHDNTVCMEGDNIPKNHQEQGTGNRPICKQCARLDAAGR